MQKKIREQLTEDKYIKDNILDKEDNEEDTYMGLGIEFIITRTPNVFKERTITLCKKNIHDAGPNQNQTSLPHSV